MLRGEQSTRLGKSRADRASGVFADVSALWNSCIAHSERLEVWLTALHLEPEGLKGHRQKCGPGVPSSQLARPG